MPKRLRCCPLSQRSQQPSNGGSRADTCSGARRLNSALTFRSAAVARDSSSIAFATRRTVSPMGWCQFGGNSVKFGAHRGVVEIDLVAISGRSVFNHVGQVTDLLRHRFWPPLGKRQIFSGIPPRRVGAGRLCVGWVVGKTGCKLERAKLSEKLAALFGCRPVAGLRGLPFGYRFSLSMSTLPTFAHIPSVATPELQSAGSACRRTAYALIARPAVSAAGNEAGEQDHSASMPIRFIRDGAKSGVGSFRRFASGPCQDVLDLPKIRHGKPGAKNSPELLFRLAPDQFGAFDGFLVARPATTPVNADVMQERYDRRSPRPAGPIDDAETLNNRGVTLDL